MNMGTFPGLGLSNRIEHKGNGTKEKGGVMKVNIRYMGVIIVFIAGTMGILRADTASAEIRISYSSSPARYHTRGWQGKGYRPHKHRRVAIKRVHKINSGRGRVFRHDNFGRHAHDYSYFSFTVGLPYGTEKLHLSQGTYWHHQGTFYRKCDDRGYHAVSAPYGAIVRQLPQGYKIQYRNGKKYYIKGDHYYCKVRGGYEITRGPAIHITRGKHGGCPHH